jgi:diacylglycerol kinase (ATP)
MAHPANRGLQVVANPAAGGGRGRRSMPLLRQALDAEDLEHRVRWTGPGTSAADLAGEALEEGFTHVAAVGGDGTVSGCAQALAGTDGVLVVAPRGTGNDFARAVGAPAEAEAVAAAAARGEARAVDVGRLRRRDGGPVGDGGGPSPRFVNGLGIGLDGAVAARVEAAARLEGKLGYTVAAVREALTFDPFPLALETPDGRVEGPTLLAGVSNGPAHGGGFQLAPGAEVDDGVLDLYRFGPVGVLTRLRQLPRVRTGAHVDLDVHERWPVTDVAFELGRATPAHLDGEPATLEEGTYEVAVEAGALTVATPPP